MNKTKLVEVMSRSPFRLRGKIVRAVNREHLTLEEIYACLSQYALVKEVKPDGQLVSLDFSNYDKFPEVVTEEKEEVVEEQPEETTETEEEKEEVVEDEVVEEQPEPRTSRRRKTTKK